MSPMPRATHCRVCRVALGGDVGRTRGLCATCRPAYNRESMRRVREAARLRRDRPDQFEETRRALESHWSLPFARWTHWHHSQHSVWLRRLAGLKPVPATVLDAREAA